MLLHVLPVQRHHSTPTNPPVRHTSSAVSKLQSFFFGWLAKIVTWALLSTHQRCVCHRAQKGKRTTRCLRIGATTTREPIQRQAILLVLGVLCCPQIAPRAHAAPRQRSRRWLPFRKVGDELLCRKAQFACKYAYAMHRWDAIDTLSRAWLDPAATPPRDPCPVHRPREAAIFGCRFMLT